MFVLTPGVQAVAGSGVAGNPAVPSTAVPLALICVYKATFASLALTGGGAWDQIIAAGVIPAAASEVEVFMNDAADIDIGFGAAASEDEEFRIIPGGNGRVPCDITAATRVAARANGAAITVGELILNFYGPA